VPDSQHHPVVHPLDPAEAGDVVDWLAAAEEAVDGELLDEAERRRLTDLAAEGTWPEGWRPAVARTEGEVTGYGAVRLPSPHAGDVAAPAERDGHADEPAAGDAAAVGPHARATLGALLDHLAGATDTEGVGGPQVWIRRVDDAVRDAAAAAGFHPVRTLAILGRDLPTGQPVPDPPAGISVRAYRPGDDAEVVRVLADAYAGTDDGGWDLETFRERTTWDWFHPADLLVADAGDGRLLGLHWLKRRDPTTGEVHNLAIHPEAQGRGLGPVLLHAGLHHLAATGCDEVLLWVDRANDRAVQLYTREGFVTRWDDVAFAR
jgi:mycothiol synthase